ncbi:aminopeptidase N [Nitrobacteraceae bacterium AZCC 2146]
MDSAASEADEAFAQVVALNVSSSVESGSPTKEMEDAIGSRMASLEERLEAVVASVEELPDRLQRMVDPEELNVIMADSRSFGESVREIAERIGDYVTTAVNEEAIEASCERLSSVSSSTQEQIQTRLDGISEFLKAWAEGLADAAQTISHRQNDWTASLQTSWAERAKELSSVVQNKLAELEGEGEALITKLDSMIGIVNVLSPVRPFLRDQIEICFQFDSSHKPFAEVWMPARGHQEDPRIAVHRV